MATLVPYRVPVYCKEGLAPPDSPMLDSSAVGWGAGFWTEVALYSFSTGSLHSGVCTDAAGVAGKDVNCKSVVDGI